MFSPHRALPILLLSALLTCSVRSSAQEPSRDEAVAAMHKAVKFFRENCSAGGGYGYRVSSDLKYWEGEGKVDREQAWIQPPATPAVGMAYLEAWRLTNDPLLKEAALATADALIRGQLYSGGWSEFIEFNPERRQRYAFRVDGPEARQRRSNETTFDDNKSQSCARFLMTLDKALEFKEPRVHEAARYALDSFVKAQYPNGAWPQKYSSAPDPREFPVLKASFPETWPREFPAKKYTSFYTLNDNTISDVIALMLDAGDLYDEDRYRETAKKGGDFFLLAQLPEPQPGWAQQYDQEMHPVWARKFEPPAITGSESQAAISLLMQLYRRTGDDEYLSPIPSALAFYKKLVLPDGEMARFYEIGTNKPLYFTKDYQLTYSDADMPTHYAFKVSSKVDRLAQEYEKVQATPRDRLWKPSTPSTPKMSSSLAKSTREVIDALDERGAWVEQGRMSNYPDADVDQVINSRTFAQNLGILAQFIAAATSN